MQTGTINQTTALLALTAALFVSCAPKQSGSSYQGLETSQISGIVGGVVSHSDFQKENGIVQLRIFVEQGEATCTGSLIARNVVLTAAHCLENVRGVAVMFALDENVTEEQVVWAVAGAVHPDFGPSSNEKAVWNDVALLKLEKDAPADFQLAKLPTADAPVTLGKGSKLTLAGYGITNAIIRKVVKNKVGVPVVVELPGVGTGTLRQVADIDVTAVTADKKEILLDQTKLRGACHGDSGGPALLQQADGSYVQVGVTSRGTNKLGNCHQGAIYTGLSGHLDWIETNKVALATAPVPTAEEPVAEEPTADAPVAVAN
jgi:secreted trypsin-like serine protease